MVAFNATVNFTDILANDYINVRDFVLENCRIFYDGIYGSYELLMWFIVMYVAFDAISRRYPRLMRVSWRARKFKYYSRMRNGILKSIIRMFGLDKIDGWSGSLFAVMANIMQKAMWFRIIQVWMNLKFMYKVI